MALFNSRRSLRFSLADGFARFRWLLIPFLPLLWLYRAVVAIRNFCYTHGIFKSTKLPALVISIGNISVGGAGKTPATIFLAKALRDEGWRVAVVARGYRRQRSGLVVVSDSQRILAEVAEAGDEALLMAQACAGIPVVVDRRKKIAAMAAVEKFSPDIILVDDGFQHRQLHRHIDIVIVDAATLFSNFGFFPTSLLREPVSALRRADFILINTGGQTDSAQYRQMIEQCRRHSAAAIFSGRLKATGWRELEQFAAHKPQEETIRKKVLPLTMVEDQPVLIVSGIARPERFREMVATYGARILHELIFADHYNYGENDVRYIIQASKEYGARYILTTTKDAAKLAALVSGRPVQLTAALPSPFLVLEVAFAAGPGFLSAVIAAVRQKALQ